MLSVLITLITAPTGAFGISFAGPRLLTRQTSDEAEESDEENGCSSSSSDTGIASKASELPEIGNAGRINISFENETDNTAL